MARIPAGGSKVPSLKSNEEFEEGSLVAERGDDDQAIHQSSYLPQSMRGQGYPVQIQQPASFALTRDGQIVAVQHAMQDQMAPELGRAVLLNENFQLQAEIIKLRKALQNSKLENADLYVKFGELAKGWAKTVEDMKARDDEEKEELKQTISQLRKDNQEMKKKIENLRKEIEEFKAEKRKLKVGQMGFLLERMVSMYIIQGDDKSSKRARYGFQLRSARKKVDNIQDSKIKENAKKRLDALGANMSEMFEDWFVGIVEEIKKTRIGTAHPNLGTFEEMQDLIEEEYRDDKETQEDVLEVLNQLNMMYEKMQKKFGDSL